MIRTIQVNLTFYVLCCVEISGSLRSHRSLKCLCDSKPNESMNPFYLCCIFMNAIYCLVVLLDFKSPNFYTLGDLFINFSTILERTSTLTRKFVMTRWRRMPFYGADFGLGTPVWVVADSVDKTHVLLDANDDKEIEAWVIHSNMTRSLIEHSTKPSLRVWVALGLIKLTFIPILSKVGYFTRILIRVARFASS